MGGERVRAGVRLWDEERAAHVAVALGRSPKVLGNSFGLQSSRVIVVARIAQGPSPSMRGSDGLSL